MPARKTKIILKAQAEGHFVHDTGPGTPIQTLRCRRRRRRSIAAAAAAAAEGKGGGGRLTTGHTVRPVFAKYGCTGYSP